MPTRGAQRPREWRTSLLGLLEAMAGSMVLLATLLARDGLLDLEPSTTLVVGAIWMACAGWSLLRRQVGEGEALTQLCILSALLSVQAVLLDDPTWRRTALALLAVVPVAGVMFLERSRLALLTGLAAAGTVAAGVARGLAPAVAVFELTAEVLCLVAPATVAHVLTERIRSLQVQAEHDARTDPLTRLLNRRGAVERASALLAATARQHSLIGVLVADIDHFKTVNDTWGHAVGDQVLVLTAETLRTQTRTEDLVVRLGGEELAVIGTWPSEADLDSTAERLRTAVARQTDSGSPRVTVSIGTASLRPDGAEQDSSSATEVLARLLDEADQALYEAKAAGRDCVRRFDGHRLISGDR